jgi:hypothetical protein
MIVLSRKDEGKEMKAAKNKGKFALIAVVLLLTIAAGNVGARIQVVDLPPPSSSSISCSASPASVTLGESITVNGSVSPAVSGELVTLTYAKPDGTTLTRTVTSGADGSFTDTYSPEVAGGWSVTTSWSGNDAYFGATSFASDFTVTEPPGVPMEYVYAGAAVAVIAVIVAVVAYWFTKKK